MNIKVLCLKVDPAVGDLLELSSDLLPVRQGFLEAKVFDIVADQFEPEIGGGLFVRLEEGIAAIRSQDEMSVFDTFDDGLQFSLDASSQALPEQVADAVGGQEKGTQLAGAAEDGSNGPGGFEDEVVTILDLTDSMEAAQAAALSTFLGGKLGPQSVGPMFQALLEESGAEAVGSGLKGFDVGDGDESVVVLFEGDSLAEKFSFNKVMTVEIAGDLKG